MKLRECFAAQILTAPELSKQVIEAVEYKRVWSGELITEGDKVLYAFVLDDKNDLLLMSLIERELDTLDRVFAFHEMQNETIPILKRK